ncbi:hypothetical protein SSCG_05684 [Streptomyces clavuligerus]|nr:hypothetical protein SSCG_05684 [Streptomyces clavuligerus]
MTPILAGAAEGSSPTRCVSSRGEGRNQHVDDDDRYPLATIVDRIREYLDQAGLLDAEEFPVIEDDVTELAREIIGDVESSFGM